VKTPGGVGEKPRNYDEEENEKKGDQQLQGRKHRPERKNWGGESWNCEKKSRGGGGKGEKKGSGQGKRLVGEQGQQPRKLSLWKKAKGFLNEKTIKTKRG